MEQNQNFFVQAAILNMQNQLLKKENEFKEHKCIIENLNHHLERTYLLLEQKKNEKDQIIRENKKEIDHLVEEIRLRDELIDKANQHFAQAVNLKDQLLTKSEIRINDLLRQIKELSTELETLKKEMEDVRSSLSYKLGLLLGSTRLADLIKKRRENEPIHRK